MWAVPSLASGLGFACHPRGITVAYSPPRRPGHVAEWVLVGTRTVRGKVHYIAWLSLACFFFGSPSPVHSYPLVRMGTAHDRAWAKARAVRGLGVGRARYEAICTTTGVAPCPWVPFFPSALPPRLLPLLVFTFTILLRCSLRPAPVPWVPACILVSSFSPGSVEGVLGGEGGAPFGTSHPTRWHT